MTKFLECIYKLISSISQLRKIDSKKKKEKKTMNVLPDGFSIVATVMSHKLAKSFILENKMSIRRYQHITFQYLHFHQILKKG